MATEHLATTQETAVVVFEAAEVFVLEFLEITADYFDKNFPDDKPLLLTLTVVTETAFELSYSANNSETVLIVLDKSPCFPFPLQVSFRCIRQMWEFR